MKRRDLIRIIEASAVNSFDTEAVTTSIEIPPTANRHPSLGIGKSAKRWSKSSGVSWESTIIQSTKIKQTIPIPNLHSHFCFRLSYTDPPMQSGRTGVAE
jgi:hypothetical protein